MSNQADYPAPTPTGKLTKFNSINFPQTETAGGSSGSASRLVGIDNVVELNGSIKNVTSTTQTSVIPLPVNETEQGITGNQFSIDVYQFEVPAGQTFKFSCSVPIGWEVSGNYLTSQTFSQKLNFASLAIYREDFITGYISPVYSSNVVVNRTISGTTGTGAFRITQYVTNLQILSTDTILFGGSYSGTTTYRVVAYGLFDSLTITGGAGLYARVNTSVLTTSIVNTATTQVPTPTAGTITSTTGSNGVAISSSISQYYYNPICENVKAILTYNSTAYAIGTTQTLLTWTNVFFSTGGTAGITGGNDFKNDIAQLGLTYNDAGSFTNATTENMVLRINASYTLLAGATIQYSIFATSNANGHRLGYNSTYASLNNVGAVSCNTMITLLPASSFSIWGISTTATNIETGNNKPTLCIERIM